MIFWASLQSEIGATEKKLQNKIVGSWVHMRALEGRFCVYFHVHDASSNAQIKKFDIVF